MRHQHVMNDHGQGVATCTDCDHVELHPVIDPTPERPALPDCADCGAEHGGRFWWEDGDRRFLLCDGCVSARIRTSRRGAA